MYIVKDLLSILKAKAYYLTSPDTVITEYIYDSRRYAQSVSALFFAIRSDKNDGHLYVKDLYHLGLRNFVISDSVDKYSSLYPDANLIQVDNSLEALQQLAQYHRSQYRLPVIGITGSNGKTIVKEWLSQALGSCYSVCKNPHSYNSQLGVPLSVLQLESYHNMAIFEAGISQKGEMQKLASIIQPTIGVLTNIGTAHDSFFKDKSEKIKEKLELFSDVEVLIYSSNDVLLNEEIQHFLQVKNSIKTYTWGSSENCDFKIIAQKTILNRTEILYQSHGVESCLQIPFFDKISIENAIHVAAVLTWLHYTPLAINESLKQISALDMRMEVKEAVNQCVLINDTYSSDTTSLNMALTSLNTFKGASKKTLILSDMLQVAIQERNLYYDIAQMVNTSEVTRFIGIGRIISKYASLFKISDKCFYDTTLDYIKQFKPSEFDHEVILLKGARSFKFEQIVQLLQQKTHETVMEVNLSAMIENLNFYRSHLKLGTKMMAMVKAFGYGSGAAEVAEALQYHGIDYLCVAYPDEGIELRQKGIRLPIMVMNSDINSFGSVIAYHLEPEIYSFRVLNALEVQMKHSSITRPVLIHIKIDSGMHRLGFLYEDLPELIRRVSANPNLKIQSVFSHLATADNPDENEFTYHQIQTYMKSAELICKSFEYPIIKHVLNTSGMIRFTDYQLDMVRLGIGLYGISTIEETRNLLKNVMTLKTVISQIKILSVGETIGYNRMYKLNRKSRIGVIPIGYADGFNRHFGCGVGHVLIRGKSVPVVGNVCMDMMMVDLTDVKEAVEGDEVIIFGEALPLNDLANLIQTIPYELLTLVSKRVPRIYVHK